MDQVWATMFQQTMRKVQHGRLIVAVSIIAVVCGLLRFSNLYRCPRIANLFEGVLVGASALFQHRLTYRKLWVSNNAIDCIIVHARTDQIAANIKQPLAAGRMLIRFIWIDALADDDLGSTRHARWKIVNKL